MGVMIVCQLISNRPPFVVDWDYFNRMETQTKIGLSVSYQMVVYHSNFGIQWGVSTQTKDS